MGRLPTAGQFHVEVGEGSSAVIGAFQYAFERHLLSGRHGAGEAKYGQRCQSEGDSTQRNKSEHGKPPSVCDTIKRHRSRRADRAPGRCRAEEVFGTPPWGLAWR